MKISKSHIYKIRRLIKEEKLLYFYADVDRKQSNSKKDFYQSIFKQGFNCYSLQHSSSKTMLEETIFKNYGFIFKDSLYVVKPNNVNFEEIEKAFAEKAKLVCVKLNNKLYLSNTDKSLSSFIYVKEFLFLTCLLNQSIKSISKFYRNNVN